MCVVHLDDHFDPIINYVVTKFPASFTCKIDLQQQAVKLSKENEKITKVLTDSTALSQAQRMAKENRRSTLATQLVALQTQLQPVKVMKIVHKVLVSIFPGGTRVKPPSGYYEGSAQ